MKKLTTIRPAPPGHWVGDGFPVRSLIDYGTLGAQISPFLLLDYAGPAEFAPGTQPLGVGVHPHRGFETVTIVYAGEVAHRDSTGQSGVIGQGDVQWMTAGAGILHEEFHSSAFTRQGGMLEMVQLWVNLPASVKMTAPRYQDIRAGDIPQVVLSDGRSTLRVIAGSYHDHHGPADTFTPLNVWDTQLNLGLSETLSIQAGHNAILVVRHGRVTVNNEQTLGEAQTALFTRAGEDIMLTADENTSLLILSGEPIDEPIVGRGPFVMNTREQIEQAITDFHQGHFGNMPAPSVAD